MQLETNRLLLREAQIGDFDRYWSMVTDPVAKMFTGGVTHLTYHERRDLYLLECRFSEDTGQHRDAKSRHSGCRTRLFTWSASCQRANSASRLL